MSLQAILFDHDGTLVDSEATHMALWNLAIEPYGVSISETVYWQQLLGVPAEQNAETIIRMHNLPVSVDALVAAKLEQNDRFLNESFFPAMADADRVLRTQARQLRLALVSGSQRHCVEASLRGHNWGELFEQVVTGDDVAHNKPQPDGYLKALKAMGLSADQAVAVEDTEAGVSAAVAAGLPTIALRSTDASSHDFSRASVEVTSLGEALSWIERQYGFDFRAD
ncbi:HAD family hydrolase [Marinobacterium arenosum]|uniref:HAD family hydrolase n=1 Tax=Marinobacterium arenosum TaxID=2862496 RepID=UPI001C98C623|nr:HAD family phosphatase [Marinobacterium arenosum]MBY4675613.1 HAD family phosphatase [Marinobacterium arenosum]